MKMKKINHNQITNKQQQKHKNEMKRHQDKSKQT